MATEKELNSLVINKVESTNVYNYMKQNSLLNEDELYLVLGDDGYVHPSYTERTGVPTANQTPAFGGTFQVSQPISDSMGHITAINSRTVTIPSATATTSANGLMSKTDKSKLDNVHAKAVSIVVNSSQPSGQVTGDFWYKIL